MTIAMPTPIVRDGYLLYECTQGSPEWLALRAGVITASEFKKARGKVDGLDTKQALYVNGILRGGLSHGEAMALAGYKAPPKAESVQRALDGEKVGRPSEVALDLAFQKAIERISKVPLDESFQTWQMKRGHKLEPLARMAHEDRLARMAKPGAALEDMLCQTAGFMTMPDGLFGCSVDSLVGIHGGGEYKCLTSAGKLRKVTLDQDISDYIDQVQGCMWISGREWWHFGLYCPALKPVGLEFQMIEVERDDDYIAELEADLIEFERIVTSYEQRLRTLGAALQEAAAAEVRERLEAEAREEFPEFAMEVA